VRFAALLIGIFVMTAALVGIVAPSQLIAIGRHVATPAGLYTIAILRVGIGLVLIGASRASRARGALRVIGAMVVVAGLATPWFGTDRANAVVNWVSGQGPMLIRLGAGVVLAFGGFITYAVARP
jgi:hypothetical protein